MKIAMAALLVAFMIGGCVHRVALYSPRRTPTEKHRGATSNNDCGSCHARADHPDHDADDDCLGCHKLCRGC